MRVLTHYVLWRLGLAHARTQTSEAERTCLARHAAGKRRLVEIGVWHGVTTARLRAVMARDAVIYAVDPFRPGQLGVSLPRMIAHREVGRVQNGVVEWVELTGAEAGRQYAAQGRPAADFVFIDGDHTYEAVRGDWEAWSPLVAPQGVIALHDSQPTPERPIHAAGSVRFTHERVLPDPRFDVIDVVETLTVLRRTACP